MKYSLATRCGSMSSSQHACTSAAEIETAEKLGFDTGLKALHPFDPNWQLPGSDLQAAGMLTAVVSVPVVCRPQSVGRVWLRSSDPMEPLHILIEWSGIIYRVASGTRA